jgi:hypothetical protein
MLPAVFRHNPISYDRFRCYGFCFVPSLRDILKWARGKRESESTPAAFKLRIQN